MPAARCTYTSLRLLHKRLTEQRELRYFREHLRPGMTIVDAGANVGFYTSQFSRLVGERGSVYAFEPDPFCAAILDRRFRRLTPANVRVEHAALGEAAGNVTLYCSLRDRAESRVHPFDLAVPVEEVRVPALRLDDFCCDRGLDRLDVVKIDVEGAELAVLRGMRGLMASRPPPWMLVEFSPRHLRSAGESPEAFWTAFAERGYEFYLLAEEGRAERICDTGAFSEAHSRGAINVVAVHRPQGNRFA
jgi:FkbM family methyltransferase